MIGKFLIILIIIAIANQPVAHACTIIAVGKKATTDGSIIISHTDTGPDSRIFVVPAQNFKSGEMAPVYWGIQDVYLPLHDDGIVLGYIPQVEHTYKYFQSAYSHLNEFQLGIGESTTGQRDELICTRESGKPGAIWAAQRLPDDAATVIPNWSIIKEIDETDLANFMVSGNYKSEAVERGWYDPTSGKPFIWQHLFLVEICESY